MSSREQHPAASDGASESSHAEIADLMEALMLLADQLSAIADEFHRSRGLHATDSAALHLLSRHAMGMSELARGLRLSPAAATSVVDRLQSAGLVERRPDQRDRRRIVVSALSFADPDADELHRRVFDALADVPPEELTHLTAIVASLRDVLGTQPD